jgi:hypothetical protein
MLAPLTYNDSGTERTITCLHARKWPPLWSRLGTATELRGEFASLQEYERAKTWENVCGLQAMSDAKCPKCPHARKEDGSPVIAPTGAPAGFSQRRRPKVVRNG